MNGAFITLILALSVIFIVICISAFTKKQLSYFYTEVDNNADSIEVTIREILRKMPASEIVVITYGKDAEAVEILQRLKNEFPQIHIIRK